VSTFWGTVQRPVFLWQNVKILKCQNMDAISFAVALILKYNKNKDAGQKQTRKGGIRYDVR